ncbi:KUP system potassium uptake protein [Nocardioides scoriae]|uniref:Probable potassium transport system protein Kup n=1 Tax=Nocardioides scoriae TaxID=642780 RepID=A0A1H1W9F8_9ACTN|nr:KUP/HAK/KT family potassium transporter [Nocardioides scoriae]SDS93602.1 KUP system potassium uptake protein [Nocardioides scoriae]
MSSGPARAGGPVLLLGALGVVFGDIGTSPLYAFTTVLADGARGPARLTPELVYGMTSTVIWSMVLVVSLLYVRLLLRADNDGEGGLLALLALLRRTADGGRARSLAVLSVVAALGAAMFLGDSVITPAISVLSAAEGLEVSDPGLGRFVVPMALVVLAVLFVVQQFGTGSIGRFFGPVMVVWFASLTVLGAVSIAHHPGVLQALSPHWIVRYVATEPLTAFLSLGAVVLAFTGAEALYADLGHFGREAIARAWSFVVLPALVVAYLGQAAAVAADPAAAANPFYALVPGWLTLPMVVLATLATIIASQAVISGAFTVVQQASRLGLLPTVHVRHTSEEQAGQIYVPAVNWLVAAAVLALVVLFGSSAALASAYGLAVTVTVTVTATMFLALRTRQAAIGEVTGTASRASRAAAGLVLALVLVFLAANLPKIASGGWLPIGIGLVLVVVMTTWARGRATIDQRRRADSPPLLELLAEVAAPGSAVERVPGSAVFFSRHPDVTPGALSTMVEQVHTLQRVVLLLTIATVDRPSVTDEDRLQLDRLGDEHDGVCQATATYGYADHVDLAGLLARAVELSDGELDGLDPATTTFFVSDPVVVFDRGASMARWRQRVYLALDRVTPDAVDLFRLPSERTVVIGRQVTL